MFVVDDKVSKQMIKFIGACPKESIVDIEGQVVIPDDQIESCSQKHLELQGKILCRLLIKS